MASVCSSPVQLLPEAGFSTPPRPPGGAHSEGAGPAGPAAPAAAQPSPDTAVKSLIAAIDSLTQQQARAEAERHAAEQAAAQAAAEGAALKAALHAALNQAAALDDQEQAQIMELDARLLEQGALEEQLRLISRRLQELRGELSGSSASSSPIAGCASECADDSRAGCGGASACSVSAAEVAHQQELLQKQELAGELQRKLLDLGLDPATLGQLCSDAAAAAHSAVAGGNGSGSSRPQGQQGAAAAHRKATWLGGGSGGSGGAGAGGLLSGLAFLRRGHTAS